jgi:hypothetical protein
MYNACRRIIDIQTMALEENKKHIDVVLLALKKAKTSFGIVVPDGTNHSISDVKGTSV